MPIRKIRWVFVCVFSVCVCRDHICEYVRAVPSVDGSAGDPVRVLCCECDSVCVSVCVCVFGGTPQCMLLRKSRWVFVCVSCVCVCRDHVCEYVVAVPSASVNAVL